MKLYIYKILSLFLVTIITLPNLVLAAEDQFYFIARQAPAASMTQEGQQNKVVYLRWDSIEGKLPSDIVAFRLLRNNEPVRSDDFPVNEIMSVSEINKLYIGNEQTRRRLEIVTKLNELAISKGDAFSASNFAVYLHGLIDPNTNTYNPLWSFLGSQTDFNIARARNRAWIDTIPSTGTVEYDLLAVNTFGETVRIGFTSVELDVETVLLGATNLKQLLNSTTRCDYPENAKDHFTVALDWESPGENLSIADRFASNLYLSGFDLYRSRDNLALNVKQAPVRDIASLASQVSSDSRGNPKISGLEKINQSLVIDSGSIENEAKWLEARDLLKRSGLKPGDRRAYYLVARDFTGNYGPTVKTLVTVPLTTRPPAPWNIRTFADQTSSASNPPLSLITSPNALLLSWDKVDLTNYMRMFQGTRKYCNATEAQQTGILEFVGIDQNCDTDLHISVRLDVVDYKIYRFTDFDVAGRFSDSDGDGVDDSVERQLGMQCDASKQPIGATSYLAPAADIQLLNIPQGGLLSNKPARVRLRDNIPAGNKDTVYWYRIASVAGTSDDKWRLSFLGKPQRGLFPDRTPPPEPIVEVLKPSNDSCEIIADPSRLWRFQDKTPLINPKGNRYGLSCDGAPISLGDNISNASVSGTTSLLCKEIVALKDCKKGSVLTLQKVGAPACKVAIPKDFSFFQAGSIEIVPSSDTVLEDADAGDDMPIGGATVIVKPPNNRSCIALFEYIDSTATRIGSTCDPEGLTYRPGAGSFCGYAVTMDENNNISASVHFPCTLSPAYNKALGAPQILSLDINETEATFTFRMPAEQAAVTMIRLDHDKGEGGNDRKITSIPSINFSSGEIISHTVPVGTLQNTKDNFCLSLKAIPRSSGDSSLNSPWSKKRCYTRTSDGEEDKPTYLPWPTVKSAKEAEPLFGGSFSFGSISLMLQNTTRDILEFPLTFLHGELAGKCQVRSKGKVPIPYLANSTSVSEEVICTDAGYKVIKNALKPQLNYLLYRQKRAESEPEGDWIQVSPLIEFTHFDEISPPLQVKNLLFKWRLNDPFIKFVKFDDKDFYLFIHHDRYPFVTDIAFGQKSKFGNTPYEFRYQAVYFDNTHKPIRWRKSDWFKVIK